MGVSEGTRVSVGDGVNVSVGGIGEGVTVGESVYVAVGVKVGVKVLVGEGVSLGVKVGTGEKVVVGIGVFVEGWNGVRETVGVLVIEAVTVMEGTKVGVPVTVNGVGLTVGERGVSVTAVVPVGVGVAIFAELGASSRAIPPTQ